MGFNRGGGGSGEHQKSLSVSRKAFLVSNNGRIFIGHGTGKKETRQRTDHEKKEMKEMIHSFEPNSFPVDG